MKTSVLIMILPLLLVLISACATQEAQTKAQLAEIESKEAPDLQFLELGKEYGQITYLMNVGGKLAFVSRPVDEGARPIKAFIVLDGREVGGVLDASHIPILYDIGGKLAFTAHKNGKEIRIYDSASIAEDYLYAYQFTDIGGKLAFTARTGNNAFIVYDGREIGKEYDSATYPTSINGTLAFIAERNGKSFVVYNGQEYGTEYGLAEHESPLTPRIIDIDGKPAFIAKRGEQKFIFYDEKQFESELGIIDKIFPIGDKLAFTVKAKDRKFIIYDGQSIGGEYDDVSEPVAVNNKLVFIATRGDKQFIVYDGKKLGEEYSTLYNLISSGKKFAAYGSGDVNTPGYKKAHFIDYNGSEVIDPYRTLSASIDGYSLIFIDDKLAFIVANLTAIKNNQPNKFFVAIEK